jgi:hypothetical protein
MTINLSIMLYVHWKKGCEAHNSNPPSIFHSFTTDRALDDSHCLKSIPSFLCDWTRPLTFYLTRRRNFFFVLGSEKMLENVQQLSLAIFKLSGMKGKAVTCSTFPAFFYDEFHHPAKYYVLNHLFSLSLTRMCSIIPNIADYCLLSFYYCSSVVKISFRETFVMISTRYRAYVRSEGEYDVDMCSVISFGWVVIGGGEWGGEKFFNAIISVWNLIFTRYCERSIWRVISR